MSVTFDSSSTGCVQSCSIPRRVGMCKRGRRVEVSLNAKRRNSDEGITNPAIERGGGGWEMEGAAPCVNDNDKLNRKCGGRNGGEG